MGASGAHARRTLGNADDRHPWSPSVLSGLRLARSSRSGTGAQGRTSFRHQHVRLRIGISRPKTKFAHTGLMSFGAATALGGSLLLCSGLGVMARSGVRERLPLVQPLFDECRPLGGVVAVQHSRVTWVGTDVDPGGPRLDGGALRARRPVAAAAINALELDLTRPFELGSVRIAGTFALPEVEDACRFNAFLRR